MKKNGSLIDNKEYAKQMRESCVKENGIVKVSEEMWTQLADIVENAILAPCNIGDTVYQTNGTTIKEYKVDYFDIFKNSVNFTFKIHLIADNWSDFVFDDDFGKTVFLTKEEAEEALKGGVQG